MWHWTEPSAEEVSAFCVRCAGMPFSYTAIGATRGEMPADYNRDCHRIKLGTGSEVYQKACQAIVDWEMFPRSWTRIKLDGITIENGRTVAMLAHVFGLWWLNACRIVYVMDEETPTDLPHVRRRFGFAYGTLLHHVETGEERFSVEWHTDDSVWYDLRAFSRPRYWLVRLSGVMARRQQKRFALDSMASMLAACQKAGKTD